MNGVEMGGAIGKGRAMIVIVRELVWATHWVLKLRVCLTRLFIGHGRRR